MKKLRNRVWLVGIVILAVKICIAQDIHFTQYYASPLTLNPALTGFFEGEWRFSGIYRNQWRSIAKDPFTTIGAGIDKPFQIVDQRFGAGLVFVNDQGGVVNLTSNRVYLNLSYIKNNRRFKKNNISVGIQPGIVFENTNVNSYSFDNQYDIGNSDIFNKSFSNDESGFNNSLTYFDLNAGFAWSNQITKRLKPEAGMAFMHLTRPSRSLWKNKNDTTKFAIRKVFHGAITIKITNRLRVKPNVLYVAQKSATDMLFGTNVEFDLKNPSFRTVYFGTLMRNGWKSKLDETYNLDASSWIVGLIWNNFNVGFSYDINISTLKEATNNRGAWEISLIYLPVIPKPEKIKIPCERF